VELNSPLQPFIYTNKKYPISHSLLQQKRIEPRVFGKLLIEKDIMGRPKNSKNPPAFGAPGKPAHLSPVASAEWDKLIGEIEASGLQVTPAHRAAISLAATIAADIADSWAAVQKDGAYVMGL